MVILAFPLVKELSFIGKFKDVARGISPSILQIESIISGLSKLALSLRSSLIKLPKN